MGMNTSCLTILDMEERTDVTFLSMQHLFLLSIIDIYVCIILIVNMLHLLLYDKYIYIHIHIYTYTYTYTYIDI